MRKEYIQYMEESLAAYECCLKEWYPSNTIDTKLTEAARFACFLAGKELMKGTKVLNRRGKKVRLPIEIDL